MDALGTSSCCRRTTLALVGATPSFLCYTPSSHPIGISCHAIIWLRCGDATYLARASLAMHPAAPSLLSHGPSYLPVCITIGTIVWVSRSDWCNGYNWLRRDHNRRRWSGRAPPVVHTATPCLLVFCPCRLWVDCTIEWVTRGNRARWAWPWRRGRPGWRCCWRRGWRRSRWCCGCRRWECCGCASNTCCHAAVLLLFIRPHQIPVRHPLGAVKR